MRISLFNIIVPLPDGLALLFHGYSGAVDLVQSRVADLLLAEEKDVQRAMGALQSETLSELKQRGYLTEKSEEEELAYVVKLGTRMHQIMKKHASPGILVIPTYSCNLRCCYCYERDLKGRGPEWLHTHMSLDMAQAALDAADRIGRWSRPSKALTLYGGEPFQCVNEPLVRFLHEKALSRGFRHFSVITNALELEKFADLLGPAPKFSFLQITLDGPPEVHDRRRFRHDGRGTFQQIAANIVLALTRGARVSVRINVDRDNAHELAPLRDYFLSQGWTGNPLFRAYCSPVHGGACGIRSSNHYASHLEMQAEVREALPASCDESPSSPFQVAAFTHAIQKRIAVHLNQKGGLPHWKTAFCGSNLSMYVFDPFGDIYPCWEVIGHPEHKIGRYGIGALDLDTAALQQWHHRSVVGIMACRRCPYLFFCGGGCEAFAYQRTGRLDQPHCFNFPEHFQQAARHAYTDWVRRAPEARQAWGNR